MATAWTAPAPQTTTAWCKKPCAVTATAASAPRRYKQNAPSAGLIGIRPGPPLHSSRSPGNSPPRASSNDRSPGKIEADYRQSCLCAQ